MSKEKSGLWANIRAQRARGEAPARKGSKDYKAAVKAAKEINKSTKNEAKLEEKVDMDELAFELRRLKKQNPGKKVTYTFTRDSEKGYVFFIDKKLVKKIENTRNLPTNYSGNPSIPGLSPIVDMEEAQDHEVSMAQSSLEGIIKAAQELMSKLGGQERNIPGWIQDHITNAENYIAQASQGFHEIHDEESMEELSLVKMMESIKK
jgi:hypothetical protein